MAIFVVELRYNVDREGRAQAHPDHADYLQQLTVSGVLRLGGPLVDDNAGLLIYETDDRHHLQEILDAEPYVTAGLVSEVRIAEWSPGKGSWGKIT